ncbi:uncharacterized protein LOC110457372 [Mizuhopecten yessoensis]|uniref:uncharacterized protein LOC110457372 n=1 Tax=Mizuhopecten yessoensis TaxID=6573 RepID=UPI000B45B3E1|nr:uncharacterized protein LOC110457372 [Mizuhopecten yessoensis]
MEAATSRSEFKYSQKVPDLHNKMVTKLSREIAPCRSMMNDWNNLLLLFSNDAPLSNVQIDGISSVGDLVRLLLGENYISYEDYEPFAKKLANVFPRMATLVREESKKIMEQVSTEKKDAGSIR